MSFPPVKQTACFNLFLTAPARRAYGHFPLHHLKHSILMRNIPSPCADRLFRLSFSPIRFPPIRFSPSSALVTLSSFISFIFRDNTGGQRRKRPAARKLICANVCQSESQMMIPERAGHGAAPRFNMNSYGSTSSQAWGRGLPDRRGQQCQAPRGSQADTSQHP